MDINTKIAEELGIRKEQASAAVKLIDEGCTIPFIARYRKEATGALSDELLRNLSDRLVDLLNKPSITIEIGSSVAPCPHWQYEIEFQKNRYVVVRIANALK